MLARHERGPPDRMEQRQPTTSARPLGEAGQEPGRVGDVRDDAGREDRVDVTRAQRQCHHVAEEERTGAVASVRTRRLEHLDGHVDPDDRGRRSGDRAQGGERTPGPAPEIDDDAAGARRQLARGAFVRGRIVGEACVPVASAGPEELACPGDVHGSMLPRRRARECDKMEPMDVEPEPVRAEVRAWLTEHWDPDRPLREWRGLLVDAGWACPSWPRAWLGRDLPPWADDIAGQEIAAAGAVGTPFGVGTGLAAPTLLAHGSDVIKQRFLRPVLTGEHTWCQLFSEPGNGSDLAGLTTRADRDGDEWVVNGQKLWSTSAHHADYGLLLAAPTGTRRSTAASRTSSYRCTNPGCSCVRCAR